MSIIRISTSCANCIELSDLSICDVHKVAVDEHYTCERFEIKNQYNLERQCNNCSRNGKDTCAHPESKAIGMLCENWSPMLN
ncbi:MAG: hypothetical protein AAGI25_14550 [Bacteroidota bacterium]